MDDLFEFVNEYLRTTPHHFVNKMREDAREMMRALDDDAADMPFDLPASYTGGQ